MNADDAAGDQPETAEIDDFTYEPAPQEPAPQVSSLIAIIRIVAVLAMGFCVSFGIFLMLFGGRGLVIGGILVLLAVPSYYGMQLAEKLANRAEPSEGNGG